MPGRDLRPVPALPVSLFCTLCLAEANVLADDGRLSRFQPEDLRFAIQAPMKARTPMTALTEPRTPWLPWLTLPEWPTELRKPRGAPAKNSMARTMNTAPMTASAMTSGRLELAPLETLAELTFLLLRRAGISGAVARLREGGISRWHRRSSRRGGEITTCRNVLPEGLGKRLLRENAGKLPEGSRFGATCSVPCARAGNRSPRIRPGCPAWHGSPDRRCAERPRRRTMSAAHRQQA